MTEVIKCLECENVLDLEDDSRMCIWVERSNGYLCESCEHEDLERASRVLFVSADGEKKNVLVGTHQVVDAEYFEQFDDVEVRREWKSTDAWRGYFLTTLDGYEEIKELTGWTTGMPDETVTRKIDLNWWLQRVYEDDIAPGCDFAIVTELTSNVFSQSVAVWVKDDPDEREAFLEWLNGDYAMLERALS